MMIYRAILCLLLAAMVHLSGYASEINENKKRAEEIRQKMWSNSDKDFSVTAIPDKWKSKSAVIIAKDNSLSYRKTVMVANLNFDHYTHERIKLLDNKAIEKYAQFTIPNNDVIQETKYTFYAGFKIVKPDGKEIIVPVENAVLEKRKVNSSKLDQLKLAIPNLEVGDILDYYIAEERDIHLSYYVFDPVIFELNDDYPIIKQRISFDILRKCYINLKSLNGAPEFKLTEDAEKSSYFLEDRDRESVKDLRWFFHYRELPTIKFKVTYSSRSLGALPVFLGDPGVIKSKVYEYEVRKFIKYFLTGYGASVEYAILAKEMKKKYKKIKDSDVLARAAFYEFRYSQKTKDGEYKFLYDESSEYSRMKALCLLSQYYASKKIPNELLIGVSRDISSLDDIVLENELVYMLKVNTPKPFYIGGFDEFAIVGEIDPDLQGQKVYSLSIYPSSSYDEMPKTEVPLVPFQENNTTTVYHVNITDLEQGTATVDISKTFKGASKKYAQSFLMDIYDYKDEDDARYKNPKSKSRNMERDLRRKDYLSRRDENKIKALKKVTEEDMEDVTVDEVSDLKIVQTGRFEDKPDFSYTGKAKIKGILKKAGPNYLVSIGKLIEGQIQITQEEKERKYNIYMPFARSFNYTIELDIPQGYTVQGVESLTMKVENEVGGFASEAKVEGNKLIVNTVKYYKSNYESVENWKKITDFLDAAFAFSQKQVLFKKS